MGLVSSCLDCAKSFASRTRDHLKEYGKTYLVVTAMAVASLAIGYWILSNVQEPETIRVGGGRALNVEGDMAMSVIREHDLTPGFRKLAELVGGNTTRI